MNIPFLRAKDLIDLGPLQLESQLMSYEHRLKMIQGSICDVLQYMSILELSQLIQDTTLDQLYSVLCNEQCLHLCDDIVYYDDLAVLCHNYRALSEAIDSYHRANNSVRIDRSVLRSLFTDSCLDN